MLQSRFVLTIKIAKESSQYFKARLIILEHLDPETAWVMNEAPTVLESSVRLFLTLIGASAFAIWSRDITLTFIQSKKNLKRNVYVRPPKGNMFWNKLVLLKVPS